MTVFKPARRNSLRTSLAVSSVKSSSRRKIGALGPLTPPLSFPPCPASITTVEKCPAPADTYALGVWVHPPKNRTKESAIQKDQKTKRKVPTPDMRCVLV